MCRRSTGRNIAPMNIADLPRTATAPAARSLGIRLLISGAVTVGLLVPLAAVTALVLARSSTLYRWDTSIVDGLHGFVLARPWLADLLIWLSTATHPNTLRIVSAVIFLVMLTRPSWRTGGWRTGLWFAITMTVGGISSPLVKEAVARSRPVFQHPVYTAAGYSFPSGHAQNSMLFAACIVLMTQHATRNRPALRAAIWTGAIALVLVIGFDRIGLGVHYTSDVLAGWLLALVTVAITTTAFRAWRRDAGLPSTTAAADLAPEEPHATSGPTTRPTDKPSSDPRSTSDGSPP
jgi:undecaprenyl-diphosphatase